MTMLAAAYRALDPSIAEDVPRKHSIEKIEACAERPAPRAARPDATALDRAVADDCAVILAAKGESR